MLFLDTVTFELYELLVKSFSSSFEDAQGEKSYAIKGVTVLGTKTIDVSQRIIQENFIFIGFV